VITVPDQHGATPARPHPATTRERVSVSTADPDGEALTVTIRVAPDGRVYFHDIPAGLVPVALAIAPDDATLRARQRAVAAFAATTDNGGTT
jgi:hypothetical protein